MDKEKKESSKSFERSNIEETSDQAAAKSEETETETETDSDDFDVLVGGIETEYSTEESEAVKTVLSPKESSTNNPKGMKNKNIKNVEQTDENEPSGILLSPTGSSTNNPKGIKRIREVEEEEEEEEDKEKKRKADSSSADTCTSTFPNESMRSPPGDQGSKNL